MPKNMGKIERLMCLADIHGNKKGVGKAKEIAKSKNIDTLLILGDFPGYGSFRDQGRSLEEIKSILDMLKDFQVMAIPGNCDPLDSIKVFNKLGINLHERIRNLDDNQIIGFGGSSPTPFGTPFEMEEDEIYQKLKNLFEKAKKESILALHNPPFNTECDQVEGDVHVGSRSVRRVVEEFQPSLVVGSHIHDSGGTKDSIGKSEIVNVGALLDGRAAIIEIKEKGVELIKI